MQVDPIKPTLNAPGTERLKLKYEELLSNFGFKFNLRRYTEHSSERQRSCIGPVPVGRCKLPLVPGL